MKAYTYFSFLIFLFFFSQLQAQQPHITGTVDVSVKNGTFKCNFLITNIPPLKKYSIRLNSGFTIQYFRDSANKQNYGYEKYYDDKTSYEAFQYTLPDSDSTSFLPSAYRIKYTGSFPVVLDTNFMYNRGDWKGNIAFNGTTVRASEQTAWYPILYDATNDVIIDKYTYGLQINCLDGNAIYLNGDTPKKGISNSFISKDPVTLLLFAGKFSIENSDGINFINTSLNYQKQKLLSQTTNKIINFYEEKLNIPYGKKITYIATTPTSKKNSWMFVTYPSVVIIGNKKWNINNLFTKTKNFIVDTSNIQFISHELGHYYFGTLFTPNSTLRWMFLEGITEYISLQYTRKEFGEEVYKKTLKEYVSSVRSFGKIIPISKIKNPSNIGEGYRYYYIPLLLTVLEKNTSKTQIWKWLSEIILEKNATTDYDFFKNTLLKCGVSKTVLENFEMQFINNENAIENVIEKIMSN